MKTTAPQQPPRCETCRYWLRIEPNGYMQRGQCRRLPPGPGSGTGNSSSWLRPVLDFDDWCGQHAPKEHK